MELSISMRRERLARRLSIEIPLSSSRQDQNLLGLMNIKRGNRLYPHLLFISTR
jgi:hypothetical protein